MKKLEIELDPGDKVCITRANGETEKYEGKEEFGDSLPEWVTDDSTKFCILSEGAVDRSNRRQCRLSQWHVGNLFKTKYEAETKRDHMILSAKIERFIEWHKERADAYQGWVYIVVGITGGVTPVETWSKGGTGPRVMPESVYDNLRIAFSEAELYFWLTGKRA